MPIIRTEMDEFTPSTYNNPDFTRRVAHVFETALGKENVMKVDPVMGGEDFGCFALEDRIPLCIFWLGAIEPGRVAQCLKDGNPLPSLHSSQFAPDPEPTIRTGMKATAAVVMDLLKK
jgi:hippurate hydrolase